MSKPDFRSEGENDQFGTGTLGQNRMHTDSGGFRGVELWG